MLTAATVKIGSKRSLANGDIGVLEVKGPNVFSGYWNMPEKTAEEFRDDGFFITGDLGKVDIDGYVHIVGRSKDLIISGGYNIYPKEIDTAGRTGRRTGISRHRRAACGLWQGRRGRDRAECGWF